MRNVDYIDLANGEREKSFFFVLNAYLHSRIDRQRESIDDEEVNVYMANLLHSLVDGRFYVDNHELLATTPIDVFTKVEESRSNHHKLKVYRANADHRIISFGLFSGFGHHRSRYGASQHSSEAYLEQAQQFYSWAALFSSRLPRKYCGLSATLEKIADQFEIYLEILRHMGSKYCNLLQRLTTGELFHLEREINDRARPAICEVALDRMLDAYNSWHANPSDERRAEFVEARERYAVLDPEFATQDLD